MCLKSTLNINVVNLLILLQSFIVSKNRFIHSFMSLVIHHLFNRPASEVFLEAPWADTAIKALPQDLRKRQDTEQEILAIQLETSNHFQELKR